MLLTEDFKKTPLEIIIAKNVENIQQDRLCFKPLAYINLDLTEHFNTAIIITQRQKQT